jgi:transcription elongation GreA/GreB family factor
VNKDIKEKLYKHCVDYVNNHIEIISGAVSEAQDAVNSETKNTAGDKHETERAMKQLETEAFGRRLDEAMQQHKLLKAIDISKKYEFVAPGALVDTSLGAFFIAISADEIEIEGEEYCVVSPESPIGQAMVNRKAGDSFLFRGNSVRVVDIC